MYGRLPVAPSGECLQNKGRHGLVEDVDGSSLPANSRQSLWVGSHLALSLHSSICCDPCLSIVSVLTLRFKPSKDNMFTGYAVLHGSPQC